LSGGQQRRLSIARALGHDSMLVLADEPTANLDRRNAERVLELLESCCLAGATVVVATHDVDLALSRPHRVVELRQGRLVADRPARAIIPREAAVARLAAAAGARKVPLRERIGRVSRVVLGYTPPPPPPRPARPPRPRVALAARAGGAVRTVLGFVPPPRAAGRGKPATGAWRPPAEVVARLSNGHANGATANAATANGNGHAAGGNQPSGAMGRPYVAQAPQPETASIWRPPPGLQALTGSTAALRGAGLTRPPRRWLRLGRRAAGLVRRALGRPPLPASAKPEDARPLHQRAGALWARTARLVLGYTPPPPRRPRLEPASRWRRPR